MRALLNKMAQMGAPARTDYLKQFALKIQKLPG